MTKFQFEVGKTYRHMTVERRTRCYVWIGGEKFKVYTEQIGGYEAEYIFLGANRNMAWNKVYCH